MSASSGTTLISPTNNTTHPHPPAPQRKHSRAASHHSVHHSHHGTHRRTHGHGHGHGHGHAAHTSSGTGQRSSRRGSEGETGRRALAAGLTMHALDNIKAAKQHRKTSEPNVNTAQPPLTKSGANSKSESHLPSLSRVASTSSMSAASGSGSGGGKKRRGAQDAGEVVEVIGGDDGSGSGEQDGEWESGEDTPAGGNSRRMTPATRNRYLAGVGERERKETAEQAGSPLLPPPPDHEPPATQKVSGFPGTPSAATPMSQPSPGAVTSATSSRHPSRPQSTISLSRPASSCNLAAEGRAKDGSRLKEEVESRTSEDGYPFPAVVPNGPKGDNGTGQKDERAGKSSAAPPAVVSASPEQVKYSVPETPPRSAPAAPPAPIRHRASETSLRSMRSFRAPPHPLNSLEHVESPRRIASLHQTPMAQAVVYRETVEGQGFDNDGRPVSRDLPRHASQNQGKPPQRMGSFSSMRSLKDLLTGSSSPAGGLPNQARRVTQPPPGQPARRQTAMQAASAVARLNTTSDPVAYHQSLGFSPATAETAHLLSRFLPPRRKRRPRWAITAREAMAAHEAAIAGEEPPEPGRIGLTDGQYRTSHESLVETLRALGKGAHNPRRGSRSLLEDGREREKDKLGRTPFELSVQRCMAQRPRVF